MVHEKSWVASFRLGVFVLLALGLTFCLPLRAQTFHGSILGTVSDPSGAAIAGASVTAKNTASGYVRTTHTTEDGTYWIPELPVGMYEVTVTMTGFQGAFASSVPVEVARDRRVDFGLTHANALQQKTQDTGVPIETTNNTQGTSFQSKEILNLPVDGRDIDELYVMAPGVAGNPSGVAGAPGAYGQFSANGNRDRSNNFLLNGGDINDSYRNLPAINQGAVYGLPSAALPLESVGEVRIQTNFDAQYGRNSGAVVNVLTNTGTNGFHGSLFEYFGNNVLNARNFFNTVGPKDAFRNNQFGGDLGGPITRDKTHFFFAYQGQREGMGLTSLNTVPTLANYQTAVTNIAGPNPGACDPTVPANTIEGCVAANLSAFNPVIQNLYNLCGSTRKCSGGTLPWPLPNAALANGLNNISSDRSRNNVDSLLLNVDHSFNSSNTMSGHFYYGRGDQSLPLGIAGGNIMPGTNTHATPDVYVGSVSLVSVISPTQTNEARFGYNRYHVGLFAQDASVFGNPAVSLGLDTTLGTVTGAPNPQDFGLPTLKVGGLSSLGSSAQANPQARVDRNYQFADNFAWKFSKNNVRMGFEIRHTSIDSLQDLNFRGTIGFDNLTSFLEGLDNTCSSCYINYGNTQRYTQQDSFGLFIQDSWQILPRLTVNAGLRWDFFGVIMEGENEISVYDPATGLVRKGQPYPNDLNNFAPRLSLAWDPFGKGKTVVRAGLGVYYDSFPFDYLTGQAYISAHNLGPAYNPVAPNPIFQGLPSPQILAAGQPIFDNTLLTPPVAPCTMTGTLNCDTLDVSTVGRLRTPYIYNFSLNVQQELTRNTVLQVGFLGTQGRKLPRLVDLNQPSPAAITAFDATCVGGLGISLTNCALGTMVPPNFNNTAPFLLPGQNDSAANISDLVPQTPRYLQQLQTTARSAYNSMFVSLVQRDWHGITQQITYTWSHSIDDASDGVDFVPHAAQPNDSTSPHNSGLGNSNFDIRNHFVWTFNYALPKAHSLGRLGEGWSITSTATLMTGFPVELVNTADNYDGSGEFFGRPDVVGPVHYNFDNPSQYLAVNAFAVPCTLDGTGTAAVNCLSGSRHFGKLGRNALISPPFRQWDLSLIKNTKLTERFTLQLRADFYNILNHPNFANPLLPSFISDLSGYTVCQAAGAGCPRGGQFAAGQFLPITATVDTGNGNPILGSGGPRSIQFAFKIIF